MNKKIYFKAGDDVTALLEVKQYFSKSDLLARETPSRLPKSKTWKYMMRYKWYRWLWRFLFPPLEKGFPSWIAKTDEERIQNFKKILNDKERRYSYTEKCDGSSATYAINGKEFTVCSRNYKLGRPDTSIWWRIAQQKNIETYLMRLQGLLGAKKIVLQGEIVGEGIQKNKYRIKGIEFLAYNLIVDGVKKTTTQMQEILFDCSIPIKVVPILDFDIILPDTVEEVIELSKGKSILNKDVEREGIVVRSDDCKVSFKAINPVFLLKNDE